VIDAVPASAEDARWLDVRAGVPLLRERRFTTDRAADRQCPRWRTYSATRSPKSFEIWIS
jgi:DNA-binding GntR family transcriptional regulator